MDENLEPKAPENKPKSSLLAPGIAILISIAALTMGIISMLDKDEETIARLNNQSEQLIQMQEKLDEIELQKSFLVDEEVNKAGFQAVFLRGGEVYFGKLRDGKLPGQVTLVDIYYLQNGSYEKGGEVNAQENIALAKLGNELHGPEDEMHISRNAMLFWENMKEDSQVVSAIRAYEQDGY